MVVSQRAQDDLAFVATMVGPQKLSEPLVGAADGVYHCNMRSGISGRYQLFVSHKEMYVGGCPVAMEVNSGRAFAASLFFAHISVITVLA